MCVCVCECILATDVVNYLIMGVSLMQAQAHLTENTEMFAGVCVCVTLALQRYLGFRLSSACVCH